MLGQEEQIAVFDNICNEDNTPASFKRKLDAAFKKVFDDFARNMHRSDEKKKFESINKANEEMHYFSSEFNNIVDNSFLNLNGGGLLEEFAAYLGFYLEEGQMRESTLYNLCGYRDTNDIRFIAGRLYIFYINRVVPFLEKNDNLSETDILLLEFLELDLMHQGKLSANAIIEVNYAIQDMNGTLRGLPDGLIRVWEHIMHAVKSCLTNDILDEGRVARYNEAFDNLKKETIEGIKAIKESITVIKGRVERYLEDISGDKSLEWSCNKSNALSKLNEMIKHLKSISGNNKWKLPPDWMGTRKPILYIEKVEKMGDIITSILVNLKNNGDYDFTSMHNFYTEMTMDLGWIDDSGDFIKNCKIFLGDEAAQIASKILSLTKPNSNEINGNITEIVGDLEKLKKIMIDIIDKAKQYKQDLDNNIWDLPEAWLYAPTSVYDIIKEVNTIEDRMDKALEHWQKNIYYSVREGAYGMFGPQSPDFIFNCINHLGNSELVPIVQKLLTMPALTLVLYEDEITKKLVNKEVEIIDSFSTEIAKHWESRGQKPYYSDNYNILLNEGMSFTSIQEDFYNDPADRSAREGIPVVRNVRKGIGQKYDDFYYNKITHKDIRKIFHEEYNMDSILIDLFLRNGERVYGLQDGLTGPAYCIALNIALAINPGHIPNRINMYLDNALKFYRNPEIKNKFKKIRNEEVFIAMHRHFRVIGMLSHMTRIWEKKLKPRGLWESLCSRSRRAYQWCMRRTYIKLSKNDGGTNSIYAKGIHNKEEKEKFKNGQWVNRTFGDRVHDAWKTIKKQVKRLNLLGHLKFGAIYIIRTIQYYIRMVYRSNNVNVINHPEQGYNRNIFWNSLPNVSMQGDHRIVNYPQNNNGVYNPNNIGNQDNTEPNHSNIRNRINVAPVHPIQPDQRQGIYSTK